MIRWSIASVASIQAPISGALSTGATRDALSMAADVAVVLLAAAGLLLCIALFLLARQATRTLSELRRHVESHLGPVSDRARTISDNVEFITQVVRSDVEHLGAAVSSLTDRLQQVSDRMEERVEEFNALMEVVQSEAEDVFIDAAATARGVREGARALTRPGTRPPATDGNPVLGEDPLQGAALTERTS